MSADAGDFQRLSSHQATISNRFRLRHAFGDMELDRCQSRGIRYTGWIGQEDRRKPRSTVRHVIFHVGLLVIKRKTYSSVLPSIGYDTGHLPRFIQEGGRRGTRWKVIGFEQEIQLHGELEEGYVG